MKHPARPRAVLLDTCTVIYLANGDPMASEAIGMIAYAGLADGALISPSPLTRRRATFG